MPKVGLELCQTPTLEFFAKILQENSIRCISQDPNAFELVDVSVLQRSFVKFAGDLSVALEF